MIKITLTKEQEANIYDGLSKDKLMDLFAENVEGTVDFFCKFIHNYVDSERLQKKIIDTINRTPIFGELFQ